jgi:hypothetical protein
MTGNGYGNAFGRSILVTKSGGNKLVCSPPAPLSFALLGGLGGLGG